MTDRRTEILDTNLIVLAEQIAAVMDGLVFTALVRGPHEQAQLRRWLRTPLHRMLSTYVPTD